MVLDVEVYPKMPRKWSKAVPEDSGPGPRDKVGFDQITMTCLYRMIEELFDKSDRKLDELTEKMRVTRQRLAGLEQDARQPHLATEADVPTDTKTHKRTENAVADQAKHANSCFAKRIDAGPPMCLTSFVDDSTEPPILSCRDDAMVDKGAAAPKLCLSREEMRTPTAAGGSLPVGTPSTVMRTYFPDRFLLGSLVKRPKKEPAGQTTTRLPLPAGGKLFK